MKRVSGSIRPRPSSSIGSPTGLVHDSDLWCRRRRGGHTRPMSLAVEVEATLLDVDLPAEPLSASQARRAVLDALSGIAVDRDAIGVVVSEAVTNAVVHAYRDRPQP